MAEMSSALDSKIPRTPPDPSLNEGRPCHVIPYGKKCMDVEKISKDGPRIESAFLNYFKRWEEEDGGGTGEGGEEWEKANFEEFENSRRIEVEKIVQNILHSDGKYTSPDPVQDIRSTNVKDNGKHEYEVIVCHANGECVEKNKNKKNESSFMT